MNLYLRLFKFIKKQEWINISAAILCIILLSACNLAMIPLASMLTKAIADKNFQFLNIVALTVIFLYFLRSLLTYGQNYLMSFAGQKLIIDLRLALYRHLQVLSLDFFSKWRTGDIMSRMMYDVGNIQTSILVVITEILPNLITLIGAIIFLLRLNARLTILTLLVAPILYYTIAKFAVQIREVALKTQQKAADITTILTEKIAGIKVVKSFTTEDHEIKKFENETDKSFWLTMKEVQIDSTQKPLLELIQAVAVTLVVWYGAYQVVGGQLSVNDIVAFFVGVGLIATPIATIGKITIMINRSLSSAERVFEFLDTEPTVKDHKGAKDLPTIKGNIQFKGIEFHYDRSVPILKGIDLKTNPGEVIAIVGRSGAGKSTFVNLIPRFFDPTSGQVLIDGHDIRECSLYSLRKQVATVHQDTMLFIGTIKDNMKYGSFDATDEQVIAAAKASHLHDFIMSLPDKYETLVGERGAMLSGGERQRVSIARALLRDPKILILDEATSSLDTESERLVQDAIEKLVKGRTTFIIAHRLSTVQIADKILVFDKGCIVEQGTHKQLIAQSGIYKKLYDLQFRDENEEDL